MILTIGERRSPVGSGANVSEGFRAGLPVYGPASLARSLAYSSPSLPLHCGRRIMPSKWAGCQWMPRTLSPDPSNRATPRAARRARGRAFRSGRPRRRRQSGPWPPARPCRLPWTRYGKLERKAGVADVPDAGVHVQQVVKASATLVLAARIDIEHVHAPGDHLEIVDSRWPACTRAGRHQSRSGNGRNRRASARRPRHSARGSGG